MSGIENDENELFGATKTKYCHPQSVGLNNVFIITHLASHFRLANTSHSSSLSLSQCSLALSLQIILL